MLNILITGGAGSLGQAFIERLQDLKLTVIDQNEWEVARLQKEYPRVEFILGDFESWDFTERPIDVLIHCAAYKHVNLGEENIDTFIENNIVKTQKLFKEAYKYNVDVLFISTDKAVEPCSLYGYTKAIGEVLAKQYNFSVARLGNILNSSGSVIPVWEKAIEEGKPIPITDERMVRYWLEDFEAVDQIWDMFRGGKKLIIPNCKKIGLLDLLSEVLKRKGLRLNGTDPWDSTSVEIIGLRPGEKISEKLRWDYELNKEEK